LKRACWIIPLSLGSSILCVSQSPPSSDWAALFNGKDLSGWKNNGQEKWVVDQGTILGESTANKYGYLTTEKSYRDFDLRLRFKGEASGNSGVFLRSKILGVDPEHGPDIEGMQVESGDRGWVSMPSQDGEKALKPGDWNDLLVSAHGNHIVTR
jgi:hypothetical protein